MRITPTLNYKPILQVNKPQSAVHENVLVDNKSFALYPKAHVPLISKVSFTSWIPLNEIEKLPCPVSGLIMLTKSQIEAFAEKVKGLVGKELVEHLQPHVENLPEVESEVVSKLIIAANAHPTSTISELILKMQKMPKLILKQEQRQALDKMRELSKDLCDCAPNLVVNLPVNAETQSITGVSELVKDLREDTPAIVDNFVENAEAPPINDIKKRVQDTIDEFYSLIGTTKDGKRFQNKPLRFKMNEFLEETAKKTDFWEFRNQTILKRIVQIADDLPTSDKSVNAFIVKYKNKINNIKDGELTSKAIAERLLSPIMSTYEHIKPDSVGGKSHISNYLLMSQRLNNLRGNMPYTEWLVLHPEMVENCQKYIDVFIDKIVQGELRGYNGYPEKLKKALLEESKGLIDIDITKNPEFVSIAPQPERAVNAVSTVKPVLKEEVIRTIAESRQIIVANRALIKEVEKELAALSGQAAPLFQTISDRTVLVSKINSKNDSIVSARKLLVRNPELVEEIQKGHRTKKAKNKKLPLISETRIGELVQQYQRLNIALNEFDKARPTPIALREQIASLHKKANAASILREEIGTIRANLETTKSRLADVTSKIMPKEQSELAIKWQQLVSEESTALTQNVILADKRQRIKKEQISALENRIRKTKNPAEVEQLQLELNIHQLYLTDLKTTSKALAKSKVEITSEYDKVTAEIDRNNRLVQKANDYKNQVSKLTSELQQKQVELLVTKDLPQNEQAEIALTIQQLNHKLRQQVDVMESYKNKEAELRDLRAEIKSHEHRILSQSKS